MLLPRKHVNPLKLSWGQLSHRAIFASQWHPRSYATSAPPDVAVIGGGITGLTTAYYLAKRSPKSKVTIYEAQSRLGGWLSSEYQKVAGGTVLFEHGPRTLRSAGDDRCTPYLIEDLGLTNEVVFTPKTAPAALYRYVYYPDRLVQMPYPGMDLYQGLWSLLTEPVFKGVIRGVAKEYFQPPRANANTDESVGSFVSRRAGSSAADNLVSAVLHGIYAGDLYQLSAKSLLGLQYWAEAEYGSLIGASAEMAQQGVKVMSREDGELYSKMELRPMNDFFQQLMSSSVYSFEEGIQSLPAALERNLRSQPNVEIKLSQRIERLEAVNTPENSRSSMGPTVDKIRIHRRGQDIPIEHDHIISTIFSKDLASLCTSYPSGDTYLPTLANTHAVTVQVVNLYFREPDLLPETGFGYLIPRTIPFNQNPERALGVIFDSDALQGQDDAPGTKVTVMLGGHWWDGWTSYPDEKDAVIMARSILARHLKISPTVEPEATRVTLQKNCIPQYTVGHFDRMQVANQHLRRYYGGKLTVAGNSYTGVGVKDCIKAAYEVVDDIVGKSTRPTGLRRFESQPRYDRVITGMRR